MTHNDIIDFAIQAGWSRLEAKQDKQPLMVFAELIAAKKEKDIIKTIQSLGTWATCEQIEKAIKVRGIK
jgi:hypothetical protein